MIIHLQGNILYRETFYNILIQITIKYQAIAKVVNQNIMLQNNTTKNFSSKPLKYSVIGCFSLGRGGNEKKRKPDPKLPLKMLFTYTPSSLSSSSII